MKLSFSRKAKKRGARAPNKHVFAAMRVGFWAGAGLGVLAVLVGTFLLARSIFFTGNDQFKVRDIAVNIVKGELEKTDVMKLVNINVGKDNLFALDVRALRVDILSDPEIQEIEIRRQLPGTVDMTVYGRTPIAQLLRSGGQLVDADGMVLPAKANNVPSRLPVITGIRSFNLYTAGSRVTDPMVLDALRFLRHRATVTNGQWLDVKIVQLDYAYRQLAVYLRGDDNLSLLNGAVVVVPTKDMRQALVRALYMLEERSRAHQPTGYVNVTYVRSYTKPFVPDNVFQ